jgi:hypothetical protein
LNAGCLYEYAREWHKYRCWLVLRHTPKRERFWLPRLIGLEFEGSSAGHNHLFMSGWGTWLDNFAEDLIANKSFEKVFGANSRSVLKSLDEVDTYCFYPKAVELPGSAQQPLSGIARCVDSNCWRLYDNGQIGEEMKRFAEHERPKSEKEPTKKRVRSDLKALSVLRIGKLHKGNPWKRVELVAKVCGYKPCKEEAKAYEERRKRGHANEAMSGRAKSQMSQERHRALSLFQWWFPWGKPSNY